MGEARAGMATRLLLAAASLVLVGCGSEPEADYLSNLREVESAFGNSEDEALIAAGNDICVALGSGESIRDIHAMTVASGLDADAGMAIAGAAVTHLCPDEDSAAVRDMIERLRR